MFTGVLIAKFENLDGSKLASLEFPIINGQDYHCRESVFLYLAWVKNNAGWWADGQIPDSAFVQGIQFFDQRRALLLYQPTEQ